MPVQYRMGCERSHRTLTISPVCDNHAMPELLVFRAYPAPDQSWRGWKVDLDGQRVGRIGGAGVLRIEASAGSHTLTIRGEPLHVEVTTDRPTWVLAVQKLIRPAGPVEGVVLSLVSRDQDLPRCALSKTSPRGRSQSFRQALVKARLATVAFAAITLLIAGLGVYFLSESVTPRHDVSGVVLLAVGAFLLVKLYPGLRIQWNQRHWPMKMPRVDHKGEENDEWKRFAANPPS